MEPHVYVSPGIGVFSSDWLVRLLCALCRMNVLESGEGTIVLKNVNLVMKTRPRKKKFIIIKNS